MRLLSFLGTARGQAFCRDSGELVDFPRLARVFAARLNEIGQKHGGFPSTETLDAFRYRKINKPLTHSART